MIVFVYYLIFTMSVQFIVFVYYLIFTMSVQFIVFVYYLSFTVSVQLIVFALLTNIHCLCTINCMNYFNTY